MKRWHLGIAVMLVTVLLVSVILFIDRRATVAAIVNAEIGEVIVSGESHDRFEQWSFRLCWRKKGGPWMEYLLERQVSFLDGR